MHQWKKNAMAFAVTLGVLGGGLYVGLSVPEDWVPAFAGESTVLVTTPSPGEWRTGEPVGILIFGCEERWQSPKTICQVLLDGSQNRCVVTVLKPQEEVPTGAGWMTLVDCYRWGGMETTAEAVETLYGLREGYYLRIDREGLETLLPPLSYGGEVLEGAALADALLTEDRCGGVWAAFLQNWLQPQGVYHLDAFYEALSACDTDLSWGDFYGENRRIVDCLNQSPTVILDG